MDSTAVGGVRGVGPGLGGAHRPELLEDEFLARATAYWEIGPTYYRIGGARSAIGHLGGTSRSTGQIPQCRRNEVVGETAPL